MSHFSHEHRSQFLDSMMAELDHAYAKHAAKPWSRHEFYGVLLEEVDELWDAIKQDHPIEYVLKEAMQIACVCLRYAETPDAYQGPHRLPLPSRRPRMPQDVTAGVAETTLCVSGQEPPLVITGPGGDFRVEHRPCGECGDLFSAVIHAPGRFCQRCLERRQIERMMGGAT